MYTELTQGIRVDVDPEYLASESSPGQFVFAYHITITNEGATTVQLVSRHWVITDSQDHVEEVKGPGVIGQTPVLKPGEKHAYSSFCILPTTNGTMRGSFQMTNHLGAQFDVKVPLFFLLQDEVLH